LQCTRFYYSADIEDIISLLDGRSALEEEVGQADAEVREFLSQWFSAELETLREIAPAFLSSVARSSGRGQFLRDRISRLAL
jgi:hypothetical protein